MTPKEKARELRDKFYMAIPGDEMGECYESSKQYPIGGYAPGFYSCKCVNCKIEFTGDKRAVQCKPCAIKMTQEEPKQETLEEAAERMSIGIREEDYKDGFVDGANYQAERSYSEEEVLKILFELSCNNDTDKEEMEEWFEQFKKK